jgi:hypothetical protein
MTFFKREVTNTGILFLAGAYIVMALLFTCGCAIHVGEAPCLTYVRAVEAKLAECGESARDRSELAKMYETCEPGPLGLAFVDGDTAEGCAEDVAAMTCDEFRARGLRACVSTVTL